MNIWVDADACPKPVRDILIRTSNRMELQVTFISNQYHRLPSSDYLKKIQVPGGFDVADEYIVEQIQAGDVVITADIPLASLVIEKKGIALNPRGKLYTKENIENALTIRNLKQELRSTGIDTGGQKPFNNKDKEIFANQLDKVLQRYL
jgi:uncharacterized protein YaiI (UPF0178 family)